MFLRIERKLKYVSRSLRYDKNILCAIINLPLDVDFCHKDELRIENRLPVESQIPQQEHKPTPARTLFISGLKSRVLKLPFFT